MATEYIRPPVDVTNIKKTVQEEWERQVSGYLNTILNDYATDAEIAALLLLYVLLGGRSGGQEVNGDTDSGGDLVLQSTAHATKGNVYIGDHDGGNEVVIEDDGTLRFDGDATVWNDLQFQVSQGKIPASNNPTWATLTTNTGEWGFDVGEYIDLASNEIPHSWKENGVGGFHAHISIPTANSTGSSRYVQLTVYVAYRNASNIWVETPLTAEKEIPDGSSALQVFYLDMGDVSFTGLGIETQIKLRVKRIAATGGTEYGSDVFIHQIGCHLEHDTIGSRTESTK